MFRLSLCLAFVPPGRTLLLPDLRGLCSSASHVCTSTIHPLSCSRLVSWYCSRVSPSVVQHDVSTRDSREPRRQDVQGVRQARNQHSQAARRISPTDERREQQVIDDGASTGQQAPHTDCKQQQRQQHKQQRRERRQRGRGASEEQGQACAFSSKTSEHGRLGLVRLELELDVKRGPFGRRLGACPVLDQAQELNSKGASCPRWLKRVAPCSTGRPQVAPPHSSSSCTTTSFSSSAACAHAQWHLFVFFVAAVAQGETHRRACRFRLGRGRAGSPAPSSPSRDADVDQAYDHRSLLILFFLIRQVLLFSTVISERQERLCFHDDSFGESWRWRRWRRWRRHTDEKTSSA